MHDIYICDYVRTPIGRYAGSLSGIRTDDLGALPLRALQDRHPGLDWEAVTDVILGCANQAGEDNRSVARMSLLLAGLPETVSGTTSIAFADRAWTQFWRHIGGWPLAKAIWPSQAASKA